MTRGFAWQIAPAFATTGARVKRLIWTVGVGTLAGFLLLLRRRAVQPA